KGHRRVDPHLELADCGEHVRLVSAPEVLLGVIYMPTNLVERRTPPGDVILGVGTLLISAPLVIAALPTAGSLLWSVLHQADPERLAAAPTALAARPNAIDMSPRYECRHRREFHQRIRALENLWCPGEDSNLHGY